MVNEEFLSLYDCDGVGYTSMGQNIDFSMFLGGYTILALKMAPFNVDRVQRPHSGQTRLHLTFEKPTTKPLCLVCYGKFHDSFTIDFCGQVYL